MSIERQAKQIRPRAKCPSCGKRVPVLKNRRFLRVHKRPSGEYCQGVGVRR